MKVTDSCNHRLILVLWTIAVVLTAIAGRADVGGGGKRQTPYDEPGKVSEEKIIKVKAVSARCRNATVPIDARDSEMVRNLALVVAKGGEISSDAIYKFEGKDDDGNTASVDFSDIKALKVIRVEKKGCLLEITTFPMITPKDLLAKKPSYSELVSNYTNSIHLWIQVEKSDGDLAIAGENWDGKRKLVARVREVKPDSTINLGYGRSKEVGGTGDAIWFATESVIQSPDYPFRLIFKS